MKYYPVAVPGLTQPAPNHANKPNPLNVTLGPILFLLGFVAMVGALQHGIFS